MPRRSGRVADRVRRVPRVVAVNDARAADAVARVQAAAPGLAPTRSRPWSPRTSTPPSRTTSPCSAPTTSPARSSRCSASAASARRAGGSCRSPTRPASSDGWESPHTVVDVVTDDAPFLVDSVSAALVRHGYDLHLVFHPLLAHERVGVTSHLHLEIDRESDPEVLDALRDELELGGRRRLRRGRRLGHDARRGRSTLADRAAAHARPRPRRPTTSPRPRPSSTGWPTTTSRSWARCGSTPTGSSSPAPSSAWPGVARWCARARVIEGGAPWMLMLTKALARSTVHRDVPLDCVNVRRVDPDGTFARRDPLRRPLHRQRLQPVGRGDPAAAPEGRRRWSNGRASRPTSHDGRTLAYVLETYPRDELFRLAVDELSELAHRNRAHGPPPARPAVREPRPARRASSRAWCTSRATATRPSCACRSSTRCAPRSVGARSTSTCS